MWWAPGKIGTVHNQRFEVTSDLVAGNSGSAIFKGTAAFGVFSYEAPQAGFCPQPFCFNMAVRINDEVKGDIVRWKNWKYPPAPGPTSTSW